jgi:serine/threonine-protein kinase SRPK3
MSNTSDSSDYANTDLGDEYHGMLLDNKYILLYKIGFGGFASVWLSYYINDPKKQFYYAIKIQNPDDYIEGLLEVETFKKIKNINSEYLMNMIEDFKFKPKNSKNYAICMVFELMACSLYQLIRRGKYNKGLPPEIIYNITIQIIKGLKDIHEKLNMIHTDIKPENILIRGSEKKIKQIIDEIDKYNLSNVDKYNLSNIYQEISEEEKNNFTFSLKKRKNVKKLKKIINEKLKNKVILIMNEIINDSESEKELEINDLSEIKIVISDFGSILDLNNYNDKSEIQTRYYRAPEIVLQCGFTQKCDIWSLGCTIYELLTGDILFDPEKDLKYDRDFHHIYWYYEICGDIPKWMIEKSNRKKDFFNKNGKFLVNKPELWNIREVIKEEKNLDDCEKFEKIINMIECMLNIDPNIRHMNFN